MFCCFFGWGGLLQNCTEGILQGSVQKNITSITITIYTFYIPSVHLKLHVVPSYAIYMP